ncbi:MAG TPA: hypothetical protein VFE28_07875 [Candidatus Krumholzibacteria bacterium]|nr:hypothetical protein [Candidatus Krumholzibacteria bacterium]
MRFSGSARSLCSALSTLRPTFVRALWSCVIPCVGVAGAVGAESDPPVPAAARAALLVRPDRVEAQPAASLALGLPWLLRSFVSPAALGSRGERFTILVVDAGSAPETVGLARGKEDVREVFARLRGAPAGSIGPHEIYALQQSPDRIALVGAQEIAEGSTAGLRRLLETVAARPERQALEQTLRAQPVPQAAATLLYFSGADEANFVRILRDLDVIWQGLARVAAPYETALKLLGTMRGCRADVWQEADSVRVQVLLVCPGSLEAKRSLVALRTARQLAPLASDAAVRNGSITPQDAELVESVLGTMRSRAEGEQVHVDLAVAAELVLPRH